MKLLTMIMHLVRSPIHHFLGGILVGLAVGWILFMFHKEPNDTWPSSKGRFFGRFEDEKFRWTAYKKFYNRRVLIDIDTSLPANDMINTSVADQLSEDIRIICLVLTKPSNHFIKAVHIKSTWGKRCTKLVFASTQEEPVLPAIKLDIPEDRAHLWGKTKAALKHIYENYRGQYDWVYKADDDTFAVMENLRYLLHYSHPSEPVYYGCRLKLRREGLDYMSGGAGYALSREALRRFIEEGLPNAMACKQDDAGNEDVEMGKCLRGVGVYLGDSLDKERKNRFTPVFINEMLVPGVLSEVEWYMEMMTNPHLLGLKCCSDTLISTHYVKPHELYLLEYLIYHVTPFGRAYRPVLDDNILAKSTNEGPTGEVTGSSSQRRQRSDFD